MAGIRSIIALAFGCAFGITFLVLACVIPQPINCLPLVNLVFYFLSPFPFLFARRVNDDFDSPNGAIEVAGFITCFIIISAFALPIVLAHAGKIVWTAMGFAVAANVVVFINIALCIYLLIRRDFWGCGKMREERRARGNSKPRKGIILVEPLVGNPL